MLVNLLDKIIDPTHIIVQKDVPIIRRERRERRASAVKTGDSTAGVEASDCYDRLQHHPAPCWPVAHSAHDEPRQSRTGLAIVARRSKRGGSFGIRGLEAEGNRG